MLCSNVERVAVLFMFKMYITEKFWIKKKIKTAVLLLINNIKKINQFFKKAGMMFLLLQNYMYIFLYKVRFLA